MIKTKLGKYFIEQIKEIQEEPSNYNLETKIALFGVLASYYDLVPMEIEEFSELLELIDLPIEIQKKINVL